MKLIFTALLFGLAFFNLAFSFRGLLDLTVIPADLLTTIILVITVSLIQGVVLLYLAIQRVRSPKPEADPDTIVLNKFDYDRLLKSLESSPYPSERAMAQRKRRDDMIAKGELKPAPYSPPPRRRTSGYGHSQSAHHSLSSSDHMSSSSSGSSSSCSSGGGGGDCG